MVTLTKPEAIERFQLALLQVMPQHVPPASYVVKGGANLRLFLESVRRSEDIHFNFVGRDGWDLQPRMEAVLQSAALSAILAIDRLKVVDVKTSKATATTGRWKFQLAGPGVQATFVAMYESESEWERMALHVATRLDQMRGSE